MLSPNLEEPRGPRPTVVQLVFFTFFVIVSIFAMGPKFDFTTVI